MKKSENEILLEFRGVTLIRGKEKVLRDLSWTVRKGEHWFILGPNGSGKTSLLEMALGYLWPSNGEVSVFGEIYGKTFLPQIRKKIGYVAPWMDEHISPRETVFEIAASALEGGTRFFGKVTSRISQSVMNQLRQMELEKFAERGYGRLSTGEKLKVILARAFMAKPKILILDEPFSALDFGSRIRIHALLERMIKRADAPSIILVTHQLEDIRPFYSHGLLLKKGRCLFTGSKASVLTPKTLQTVFDLPRS